VEPPAGIEPATPSLPFVWSRSYRGAVQVKVTRVTVSDRQAPPETVPYGTQMARRPIRLNLGRRVAVADLDRSGATVTMVVRSLPWLPI
jgi:hypothetical protein